MDPIGDIQHKKTGISPTRRPPPPPPPSIKEDQFITVDGVPPSQLAQWFAIADTDKDEFISSSEALNFFPKSGLAPEDLSRLWRIVARPTAPTSSTTITDGAPSQPPIPTTPSSGSLSKRKFSQMLRLIAFVQNGFEPTPSAIAASLRPETWLQHHGHPLPPPMLNIPTNSNNNNNTVEVLLPMTPFGRDSDLGPPPVDADVDLFGLGDLKRAVEETGGAPGGVSSSLVHTSSAILSPLPPHQSKTSSLIRGNALSSRGGGAGAAAMEVPVAFDARLPPLNPKKSASLTFLAAGGGSLFAGPGNFCDGDFGAALIASLPSPLSPLASSYSSSSERGGTILRYIDADGTMGAPRDKQERRAALARRLAKSDSLSLTIQAKHSGVATEDEDSAPCQQLTVTTKKKVMCVMWDDARDVLWVGDDDGHVSAYSIGSNSASGRSTGGDDNTSILKSHILRYRWQAHRMGHIAALSLGPSGDLWTASSRGTIRIWTPEEQQLYENTSSSLFKSGTTSHHHHHGAPTCRELRRGPNNERAHGGAVVFMKCTTDGQVMWSASSKNILLWDAHSGIFLGTLYRQGKKNLAVKKSKVVSSSGYIDDIGQLEDKDDGDEDDNNDSHVFGSPAAKDSGTLPGYTGGGGGGTDTGPGLSMASSSISPAPLTTTPLQYPALPPMVVDAAVGIAVDKTTGAILARPNCTERRELRALQESWGNATDAAVRELVERVAHGGGKVVAGAKKAGKFLMKVVGKVSGDAALQQQKEREREQQQQQQQQQAAADKLALEGGKGGRQGSGFFSTSELLEEMEYLTPRGEEEYGAFSSFNSTVAMNQGGEGGGMLVMGNIQGIEASRDNCMWVAYRNGHIEKYSNTGKLVSWTSISPSRYGNNSIAGAGGAGVGGSFIGGGVTGTGGTIGKNIQTIVAVGERLWVGTADGRLLIYAIGTSSAATTTTTITTSSSTALLLLKAFSAHPATILSMTTTNSRVYTLAADGGIKGWSCHLPTPADLDALVEWRLQAPNVVSFETISMLCVTWNVGESRPGESAEVFRHLAAHSGMRVGSRLLSRGGSGSLTSSSSPAAGVGTTHNSISQSERLIEASGKDLVIVCLQEVEMGSTSVALAAYKDALSSKLQEQGNVNARFWSQKCLHALGSGEGAENPHFRQIGLRQLSGMLVMVFARSNLNTRIGEVATASVACGVLGVGGNKGAVAVEFTLYRRKFTAVCSHFAAHQGAVDARNAHYATIVNRLRFSKPPAVALTGSSSGDIDGGSGNGQQQQQTTASRSTSMNKSKQCDGNKDINNNKEPLISGDWSDDDNDNVLLGDADGVIDDDMFDFTVAVDDGSGDTREGPNQVIVQREGTRNAEVLIWGGDFNYRIDGVYESVKLAAQAYDLVPLLEADQLRREIHAGRVFKGLKEGKIDFKPTYKFDKGASNPTAYDSSEKKRIPAWCDRIFFRGTPQYTTPDPAEPNYVRESEEELIKNPDDVHVRLLQYDCWPDVIDSDHKPVFASLEADLPVTDQHRKRTICADILEKYYTRGSNTCTSIKDATISLSSNEAKLHPIHMPTQAVLLKNANRDKAVLFRIIPWSIPQWCCAIDNGENKDLISNDGSGSGGGGGPVAIDVWPMSGVIPAGQELAVHMSASIDNRAIIPGGSTKRVFKVVSWVQGGGGEGERRGVQKLTAIVVQQYSYQDKY